MVILSYNLNLLSAANVNFSISSGVLNNHIDPPTGNKMQPVWNLQLSGPKEKKQVLIL